MRNKSAKTQGYIVYAVAGTNTVSFAIDGSSANTKGLLGFAVERINNKTGDRKFMNGYKVFKELIPHPTPDTTVNTFDHPVQSFLWDDFTCFDDTSYTFLFYPLKGSPQKPDRKAKPIEVDIQTEALFSNKAHDIFFNRGVASSQSYRRNFNNLPPDKIKDPVKKQKALDWLSRQLDDAILRFINQAKKGDTLLGCFYECHYEPVLDAFKKAIDKGVIVKLIVDAKRDNAKTDTGQTISYPWDANLKALKAAGIPHSPSDGIIFQRKARKSEIQHNKFMVWLDGKKNNTANAVWTGSTNLSMGGIHGQTNVGHWLRNPDVAEEFRQYWNLLSTDPGGRDNDDASTKKKKNAALKDAVEGLQPNIVFDSWDKIPMGTTPVFSPRSGLNMLETYVGMLDNAVSMSGITLAFGINKLFKDSLRDNTNQQHLVFTLLEKKDKASKTAKEPFTYIGAYQNVYKAWGSYLNDNLYNWAREVSTRHLGLNKHVAYIHSKFLLIDPLSNDPVVVTGSANFSEASTNDNDENMLIIRGDTRVSDIYFTEFNRLFNHFYFRSVYENLKSNNKTSSESLFLLPNDSWLEKYTAGKFRQKKVAMYAAMEI